MSPLALRLFPFGLLCLAINGERVPGSHALEMHRFGSLFFGDLGERVESSVRRCINVLEARRSPIAAHSPDNPWLKKSTLLLAGSSARAGSLGRARPRRSSGSSGCPATATCWSAATARPMTRCGATSETSEGGIRSSASSSPHTSARGSWKSRDDLASLRGAEMS